MAHKRKDEVLNFLKRHRLATLSTSSKEGVVDAAPVYYIVDENFTVSFVAPGHTRKVLNIQEHPSVVLTITNEDTREVMTIYGEGRVSKTLVQTALKELSRKINDEANDVVMTLPLFRYKDQKKVVVDVKPAAIRYRRFTDDELDEVTIDFDQEEKAAE